MIKVSRILTCGILGGGDGNPEHRNSNPLGGGMPKKNIGGPQGHDDLNAFEDRPELGLEIMGMGKDH